MKYLVLGLSCLYSFLSFSQNTHSGILLDSETKEPIEFVNIYNSNDQTISNEDGQYAFTSSKDSVFFYRVGYDQLATSLHQLRDTTLLNKSVLELNEVVVTNAKSLLQKITDSLLTNYTFQPYKEKFEIRLLSKYNGEIYRLQDLKGKLARNFFIKKNTQQTKSDLIVELNNMRAIGRKHDERNAYLSNSSFEKLLNYLSGIKITEAKYNFKEKKFGDGNYTKLEFIRNLEIDSLNFSGYYIINNKDLGVKEFYLKQVFNDPYSKSKSLRYRTQFLKRHLFFEKNEEKNKYYLKLGKLEAQIETTDKDRTFFDTYDINYLLKTSDNFGAFEVNKNVNSNKDIFKLKYPYNPEYWNTQNQLLLTEEMQEFINEMGNKNTEFKVKSNMN